MPQSDLCVSALGPSRKRRRRSPSAPPHPAPAPAASLRGRLVVLLLLNSELVSGVLGVPLGGVVRLVVHAHRLVAVLQLRRLDRELVAVPQVVTTGLVVRVQLQGMDSERGGERADTRTDRTIRTHNQREE